MTDSSSSHRQLTIMQILPALEGGGVERGTLEISRGLVERGHRSLVVSAGGRLVEQLKEQDGQHITLDIGKKTPLTLFKTGKLRRLFISAEVDLVHVRSRMPAWVTLAAWKSLPPKKRPRLVTTVHGLNSVNAYSQVMTYGEQVIAVSNCCRDYVLENYPQTDPQKITVIHRGVDSSQFPYNYQPSAEWLDRWYAEFPQLKDRFVVLLPGRITRLKGHADLLQIVQRLKAEGLPIHGLIVGGVNPRKQSYADELKGQADQLNISNDITFAGHRSDLREIMSVSSAVVSLTNKPPESFGRTVLEAVKLGRPTIGYAHGGVGEVLSNIYAQGCVELKDIDGVAEKLSQIYHKKLPLPEPTEEFGLSTMLDQEIELYESLC